VNNSHRHIETYVHNKRIGVMVLLETSDQFTVRTAEFQALASDIALHIAACCEQTGEFVAGDTPGLLTRAFVQDEHITLGEHIREVEKTLQAPVTLLRYFRITT